MDLVKQIESSQIRTDLPDFASGDNVSVHYKIREGEKERIQVFQGTVLGPPLWNQYVGDARSSVEIMGYTDTTYADDMHIFKKFDRERSHDEIFADVHACQQTLHSWGAGNRVSFDPDKEHFHIIHRLCASQSTFKILGVKFDSQLNMHAAVNDIACQAGWRLNTLLRTQPFSTCASCLCSTNPRSSLSWKAVWLHSSTHLRQQWLPLTVFIIALSGLWDFQTKRLWTT